MPSGRPDWFGTIVAAGKYDTTYIPIALDVDGFITATMKGAYDAVLKTIAVDSDGVMKANISVQDLAELIMRPKYGSAAQESHSVTLTASGSNTLKTITGTGILYGGRIWTIDSDIDTADEIELWVDGVVFADMNWVAMKNSNYTVPEPAGIYIVHYDTVEPRYVCGLIGGITFETSISLRYVCADATARTMSYGLLYALI